jgi:N-methylhydantoinase A
VGSRNMTDPLTKSVRLFLHRGVSFCDATLIDSESGTKLHSSRWLYSKHKFKSTLENLLKPHAEKLQDVTLLDEFADRLSGLRLGGSVAAVFPLGLEHLTTKYQKSPIHSESVVLVEPAEWTEAWLNESLEALKKHSIKRLAWQCFPPKSVEDFFEAQGFENFKISAEGLYSFLHWRRNLLNASCSGPITEMTEEVQTVLTTLQSSSAIYWLDEDFTLKTKTQNRYGLTSTWTHLVYLWANEKLAKNSDLFILDWDGCYKIGAPKKTRWTPWGEVVAPLPSPEITLLKLQPTQTLEKNLFDQWQWIGKSDQFEPGPIFLGRGLKPTLVDLAISSELVATQFEVKSTFAEKLHRQISSQMGFKHKEDIENAKKVLKAQALSLWADEIFHLSNTTEICLLGPFVEELLPQIKLAGFSRIHTRSDLPTLAELYEVQKWSM